MTRPLYEIARDIQRNWKNVNYAAKPYLEALHTLGNVKDNFYYDTGYSIVSYFLANASSWRGDDARRIKAELKEILKGA